MSLAVLCATVHKWITKNLLKKKRAQVCSECHNYKTNKDFQEATKNGKSVHKCDEDDACEHWLSCLTCSSMYKRSAMYLFVINER